MIIFREIEIKNYRNIKHAELNGLRDLNIIIGPNNCGKTNILELVNQLSNLSCGGAYGYSFCPKCNEIPDIEGIHLPLREVDKYLKEVGIELI